MSDAAATLALCKWLTARIKVWEADAKSRLGLLPGERKAATITNQVLGYVSMVKGRTTARVVNEAAFLAFVNKAVYDQKTDRTTQYGAPEKHFDICRSCVEVMRAVTEGKFRR